jgi:hypothetical protein
LQQLKTKGRNDNTDNMLIIFISLVAFSGSHNVKNEFPKTIKPINGTIIIKEIIFIENLT